MGDSIMIGTKEISLSKALKYYDDPLKCQRKLELTEKEYKSLLNKMIKRVQGQGHDQGQGVVKSRSKAPAVTLPVTLPVNERRTAPVNREPVRFQPPIVQDDIMLPMPQPAREATSNVNPVDGRTPIQAPLWFDMLGGVGGETKPSVEHGGKINNESIGHRQLTSQILPQQSPFPRFQPELQQSNPHQAHQAQQMHMNAHQAQQMQMNPQQTQPMQQFQSMQMNTQQMHQAQPMQVNPRPVHPQFQQPVQAPQPQFNPQQFRQQTIQSRSSPNDVHAASSRIFDIGRTDFPAIISRVPHNTRIKTPKNDFN